MILSDNETKVDLLNYEAISATIVKLLREHPEKPITVGVHGDWGAGKSSVLEMIEAGLESESKALCLKFNGWRFQGFEDAKIALIEGVVEGLLEKRPLLTKASAAVKEVARHIDWLKVAKKAGGLAFTAFTGIPTWDQLQTAFASGEALISGLGAMLTKENVEKAYDEAKGLVKSDVQSKSAPKEIAEFRKAFDKLLDEAGIDQLVVLIDDLDRCLPDIAIETLEAVRLFVFTSRTAFVVAADEAMIEYAVRKHFPDLPDTTGPMSYSRNYLEKLIQVPFRIPALGETETRIYVTLLLVGAEIGENDQGFNALISTARERLRKPWTSGPLDAAAVKTALGVEYPKVQNSLILSEQIGPILASGTKGNPRQIKRFLNTLALRQRTAEARGFGDDVKTPVLAKLMLAERFLPRLFDQIAAISASSSDGLCSDLALLETKEGGAESKKSKTTGGAKMAPAPESAQLTEWRSSAAIQAWADVQPRIGEVDLRPYLFVAKDRKDYFGAASILGHLAGVIESLLGPKLAVQALDSKLKQLAFPEAGEVFEGVRGRIVGADAFDTEPAGAAGLAVLVRSHPGLQGNLLDFLEGLPSDRVGPWVCSGWDGALKDTESKERFQKLLIGWSEGGGTLLKASAQAILKTPKLVRHS
jgi:predicted KAP-like P-loop ATPase